MKIKTYFALICMFFAFATTNVYAGGYNTSMTDTLCATYGIFTGPIGKIFGMFAIVALGVGFFLGKVSWGTAIAIALGLGAIFGAGAIANQIAGGDDACSAASGNQGNNQG